MTVREFLNASKILRSLDMDELVNVGAIDAGDITSFDWFRNNPVNWMAYATDARAEACWKLVEARL